MKFPSSFGRTWRLLFMFVICNTFLLSVTGLDDSESPTGSPTPSPSKTPTATPTISPSVAPSEPPTGAPSKSPTIAPTKTPTKAPTKAPTKDPTKAPTKAPTKEPTKAPTKDPTKAPTKTPTKEPTKAPTKEPTKAPTGTPTVSPAPTVSANPTGTTDAPSAQPTDVPTAQPTAEPTENPTKNPTKEPTKNPTKNPTKEPTKNPTKDPTREPTRSPTAEPTRRPTPSPTREGETRGPTKAPTESPTEPPTRRPTRNPTPQPTKFPTREPTKFPTASPTTVRDIILMNLRVMVPKNTRLRDIEEAFEEVAESILLRENDNVEVRQRELGIEHHDQNSIRSQSRLLQAEKLPNNCVVENEGISDKLCNKLGDGEFSYKCDDSNKDYVCCETNKGFQFNTGSLVGECTRNDDDYFDPHVNSINADASKEDCFKLFNSPIDEEINKCVRVILTIAGADGKDLNAYVQTIEDAVESGILQSELQGEGINSIVEDVGETESPSASPSKAPQASPSTSPTIADICPFFSNDCKGCVFNKDCLYCQGTGICYNEDPDKRVSTTTGDFSRRILEPLEECKDTPIVTELVCDAQTAAPVISEAPSMQPTICDGNSTDCDLDPDSSGMRSALTIWNALVSGVISVIILSVA